MSLIPGTNILVDKFSQGCNDTNSYVYFLSHFHTDHYSELNDTWNLGIIYMSDATRILLLDLYPGLITRTVGLELGQKHQIYLDKDHTETVQVTLFDSNHWPGSVIMLFEGKMGRVLHTGDFRFWDEFFNYYQIFPPELMNKNKTKWSIEIDHLIMDATFADPIRDHPSRQEAFEGICSIIKKHKGFKVYLFVYLLGKEEVFQGLAKRFKTKIVVDQERYRKIELLGLEPELYTTDPDKGWIFVKTKEERKEMDIDLYNEIEPTIFISLSGRGIEDNCSKRNIFSSYYSSHSNARELENFVKAIFPKRITYHSHPDSVNSRKFRAHLTKDFTEEGKDISLLSLQPWKQSTKGVQIEKSYTNWIIDRFDEKVKTKMNKKEFLKQNPFMERKRKRFVKSGAKLINNEPILSLSDEEEEYKDCIKEEAKEDTLCVIKEISTSEVVQEDNREEKNKNNRRTRKSKRKESTSKELLNPI